MIHRSNAILGSLPEKLDRFRTKLTPVALPVGSRLYEAFEAPRFAHFLTSGVASVITTMNDGQTVETGMWGSEGLPECMHLDGNSTWIANRCFMHVSGSALRMPFSELEEAVRMHHELRRAIGRKIQMQALMLSRLVACNRLHGVEARLARWLLMLHDRVGGEVVLITQEVLAEMLGARRSTVNVAAGALRRTGSIEYDRGRLHIMRRERLESVACECYPILRDILAGQGGCESI